jgi:hypothetical protein
MTSRLASSLRVTKAAPTVNALNSKHGQVQRLAPSSEPWIDHFLTAVFIDT